MCDLSKRLADECGRQQESCLYTSTALFIWLRVLRWIRIGFVVVPLVLGSLASGKLLLDAEPHGTEGWAAAFALIAGLLPTIYAALKFDDKLKECANLAAEFKNLQDRFRQAQLVDSLRPVNEFEVQFKSLMNRLEAARKPSFTTPEWCFRSAQEKIKKGDYTFNSDLKGQG